MQTGFSACWNPWLKELGSAVDVGHYREQWANPRLPYTSPKVSLDDCVAVNNLVEPILDETDPIPRHNLEVSSPPERTLKRDKEFAIFKGRDCRVNFAPLNGVRSIEGVLTGLMTGR